MEEVVERGRTLQFGNYQEYKNELDTELRRTAEGFVRIGYLLKVAKDTDILRESGYENVYDFAKAEYAIDKSQVSRFIRINDRFSEGGYSDHLQEKYQEFGYAKLAIMIQLPDEINEELTKEFSKAEIQTIKEEVEEERKISDIEVMLEGQDHNQHAMDTIHKVIHQLFHEQPELYTAIHACIKQHKDNQDRERMLAAVREILAPAGENIYSIRIQGIGKIMVSVKEHESTISMTNVRSGEKDRETWETTMTAIEDLVGTESSPETGWSNLYNEEFPKNEEVAPVQPKKPSRVEKKKEVKTPKKPINTQCETESEEQLPGQMQVSDFPEYMPEPKTPSETPQSLDSTSCDEILEEKQKEPEKNAVEHTPETPQSLDSTLCDADSEERLQMPPEYVRKLKNGYFEEYAEIMRLATADGVTGRYDSAIRYLEKARDCLLKLKELPETDEEEEDEE